jgi:hypothetical protein
MDTSFNLEPKYNCTILVISGVTLFLVLFILGTIYECTESFTNFEPLMDKLNPQNIMKNMFGTAYDATYKPEILNLPQPANCVCAYDIDHTLNCGNPKPSIDKCKQHGCKLALNTARPSNFIKDIPLKELGFVEPWYNYNDHYYNINSYQQTARQVGEVKSTFLETLKNKYNVPSKECVVLLDDAPHNIEAAQRHGYSTIKAFEKGCGIGADKSLELEGILSRCH